MSRTELGSIRVMVADTIRSIDRIVDAVSQSVMLGQDPDTDMWEDVIWTLRTSKGLLQEVWDCIPR